MWIHSQFSRVQYGQKTINWGRKWTTPRYPIAKPSLPEAAKRKNSIIAADVSSLPMENGISIRASKPMWGPSPRKLRLQKPWECISRKLLPPIRVSNWPEPEPTTDSGQWRIISNTERHFPTSYGDKSDYFIEHPLRRIERTCTIANPSGRAGFGTGKQTLC